MDIIFDARALRVYPVGNAGFTGATELMLHRLASGLASRGHTVCVTTPDLNRAEQRGPTLWYWPPVAFPTHADVVIAMHNLAHVAEYDAPVLVLASNGPDPYLGPNACDARLIDRAVCFSQTHVDLLRDVSPEIPREKCRAIGLGVDPEAYRRGIAKTPGRMLWASDPTRGLWHMLDIFRLVREAEPEAELRIAYDFASKFDAWKWDASSVAEALWRCKFGMEMPGVTAIGGLRHEQMAAEQMAAWLFAYPCDPLTPGTELFCLAALESAAAGCPLILSDLPALREVFADAATFLPIPGTYSPADECRFDVRDWADVIVEITRDVSQWIDMSNRSKDLAERHTWGKVVDQWEAMLRDALEESRSIGEPILETAPSIAGSTSTTYIPESNT